MKDYEKKICDDLLRYGEIVRDMSYVSNNKYIRQYTIVDTNGEKYDITKRNGEWVYLFHYNN